MLWRLSKDAGLSDEVVRVRRQRYDAMWWAVMQLSAPQGEELDDPANVAKAIDQAEQHIQLGEIGWGRRLLQRAGVSEADAAARYGAAHRSIGSQ